MSKKQEYIIKITRLDYTDIPVGRSSVVTRRIEATKDEAKALKKRFKKVFETWSDGNDQAYQFSILPVETTDSWTLDEANNWLDTFAAEHDLTPDGEDIKDPQDGDTDEG